MRTPKTIVVALIAAIAMLGCKDNEITFFVEHAKVPAEAPNCSYTPGDNWASMGLLDLSFRGEGGALAYETMFLVTNQLMSRENYDNLTAETAGVFIEGMEVFVQTSRGEGVGSSEYFEFENFISPESSDIAWGMVISPSVVDVLASQNACLPLSWNNYPPQTTGNYPITDVNAQLAGRYFGFVYANVVFLGHTGGDVLVETPEFTFPIHLCCGCLVEWGNCLDDCNRYCTDPQPHGMCSLGVANGGQLLDCRALYHDVDYTPPGWDADAGVFCDTCD